MLPWIPVGSVIASLLIGGGRWLLPESVCRCHCTADKGLDSDVLEILRGQLDRCGPENLVLESATSLVTAVSIALGVGLFVGVVVANYGGVLVRKLRKPAAVSKTAVRDREFPATPSRR